MVAVVDGRRVDVRAGVPRAALRQGRRRQAPHRLQGARPRRQRRRRVRRVPAPVQRRRRRRAPPRRHCPNRRLLARAVQTGPAVQGRRRRAADAPRRRVLVDDQAVQALHRRVPRRRSTAALEDRSDRNAVRRSRPTTSTARRTSRSAQESIAWLEESPGQRVCRVLSNAKCLTEGVDVPALDAVLFLNPRKSIVDVVQAVGRVMRQARGQGLRLRHPADRDPRLDVAPKKPCATTNATQVVWQVLQALRSHDERLAAEINKIDINKTSSKVSVIGIGLAGGDDPTTPASPRPPTASRPNVARPARPGRVARRPLRANRREGRRPPVHGALGDRHRRHRRRPRDPHPLPTRPPRTEPCRRRTV